MRPYATSAHYDVTLGYDASRKGWVQGQQWSGGGARVPKHPRPSKAPSFQSFSPSPESAYSTLSSSSSHPYASSASATASSSSSSATSASSGHDEPSWYTNPVCGRHCARAPFFLNAATGSVLVPSGARPRIGLTVRQLGSVAVQEVSEKFCAKINRLK